MYTVYPCYQDSYLTPHAQGVYSSSLGVTTRIRRWRRRFVFLVTFNQACHMWCARDTIPPTLLGTTSDSVVASTSIMRPADPVQHRQQQDSKSDHGHPGAGAPDRLSYCQLEPTTRHNPHPRRPITTKQHCTSTCKL